MDPSKMVGAMGHHTAGNRCFDQSECKEKMRDFQQEAFDKGMRYTVYLLYALKAKTNQKDYS